MSTDADLDATLRSLDVAHTRLTAEQVDRKAALLASIVGEAVPVVDVAVARRRGAGRWVRALIPAAAAAAVVGLLVLPGSLGASRAYASWTPQPRPVVGDVLARSSAACRAAMADTERRGEEVPPELRPDVRAETARTVVAEQRGDFLFLAMATDTGATAQCFLRADDPGRVYGTTGSAPTPSAPPLAVLAADQIESEGAGLTSGPEGSYAFAQGRVGSDVRAVTLRVGDVTVEATVSDGWFAAWWPTASSSRISPSPIIAYDLSLTSGVVVKDADPGYVQGKVPGPREIGRVENGGGATDQGMVQTVAGHAGSEVVRVTVRVGDKTVSVPVINGVFTATWPSEVADAPAPTYDLTLKDGAILQDQKPVSGAGS